MQPDQLTLLAPMLLSCRTLYRYLCTLWVRHTCRLGGIFGLERLSLFPLEMSSLTQTTFNIGHYKFMFVSDNLAMCSSEACATPVAALSRPLSSGQGAAAAPSTAARSGPRNSSTSSSRWRTTPTAGRRPSHWSFQVSGGHLIGGFAFCHGVGR